VIDRARLLIADLERIPDVVRAHAVAGVPDLGAPAPRQVVLTGLGSSRFAALALAPTLREAGLDVVVEHASTSRPVAVAAGTLVVAISSSGRTPETVAAAERARAAGATVLAVTNQPDSPVAGAASTVILLAAGEETCGVASVTYAATLAALVALAQALGAQLDAERVLADASEAAAQVIRGRDSWLGAGADLLGGGPPIHILADAGALGTAEQAALLFREGPRLDADATDAGDWLHVGIYSALPGYRAVLLAGTRYDAELIRTIHGRGGHVVAIGPAVGVAANDAQDRAEAAAAAVDANLVIPLPRPALRDPLVRAIAEPLVTSSLAAELWRRTRASDR
jgi:fructoselysine-6-P-deglycase FrlB-like protein